MPLVQIDVPQGFSEDELSAIGEAVHRAQVEHLDVPERDRFRAITEHAPGRLTWDRGYLDIERSDRFVLVRVTLSAGRTTDAKQAFYAGLCELLVEAIGLRPEDLAVVLVENTREDWSFGLGQASYVVLPRERWR
jgi:4-oxalocrotonate tautomerase